MGFAFDNYGNSPAIAYTLLDKWSEGYDVVSAVRDERMGETFLKRKTEEWFYKLMQHLGPVSAPQNAGDFRLMSHPCLDALYCPTNKTNRP